MQASGFSGRGDARLPAGQAFAVERVFLDEDGQPIDLTGRAYTLSFFALAGALDLDGIDAAITGPVARFVVPSAVTLALAAAKLAGVVIGWQIVERLGDADVDFVFGPQAFDVGKAGGIGAGQPSIVQQGLPVIRVEGGTGSATLRIVSQGAPGIPQWQAMGFANAAAYDAKIHADAVAAAVAILQPLKAEGIAIGGEATLAAPADPPDDGHDWVDLFINKVLATAGVDFTTDGTRTLHLAQPLAAGDSWFIRQYQRALA